MASVNYAVTRLTPSGDGQSLGVMSPGSLVLPLLPC